MQPHLDQPLDPEAADVADAADVAGSPLDEDSSPGEAEPADAGDLAPADAGDLLAPSPWP